MCKKKRNRLCIQVQEVYLLTHLQGTRSACNTYSQPSLTRRSVLEYWSLILFCLYIACFSHSISWNIRCNVRLKSFSQFVHFKEINSNVYPVIVFGVFHVSTIVWNGIWYLILLSLSKPVLAHSKRESSDVRSKQVSLKSCSLICICFI